MYGEPAVEDLVLMVQNIWALKSLRRSLGNPARPHQQFANPRRQGKGQQHAQMTDICDICRRGAFEVQRMMNRRACACTSPYKKEA
jgi:hypothetical protein